MVAYRASLSKKKEVQNVINLEIKTVSEECFNNIMKDKYIM